MSLPYEDRADGGGGFIPQRAGRLWNRIEKKFVSIRGESPEWRFSAEEFATILPNFQNEQFVDMVIHYYRHRWGAAPSSPLYESQETKLRDTPPIPVPAVFMCGTSDACNLPERVRVVIRRCIRPGWSGSS